MVSIQKSAEIRALVLVAVWASEREVFRLVSAAMLQTCNMVNLKREEKIVLMDTAVFATKVRTFSYKLPKGVR